MDRALLGFSAIMPARRPTLPNDLLITESIAPAEQAEVAATVARAHAQEAAVYTVGGRTAIDFGQPAKRPGIELSLAALRREIDYPARDMTVTIEAGMTMAALAELLAREGQRLPIDAPRAEVATIGGVVATAFSGPRRYGHGTPRDYVIGITAVDGRGTLFHGGGRVVKNVAGYDFCKLLTGSLGSLAVITQVTLKVKPLCESTALVACDVANHDRLETMLAAMVNSQTTPAAIECVSGEAWIDDPLLATRGGAIGRLVVGLEGSAAEVSWMIDRLSDDWRALGVHSIDAARDEAARGAWRRLVDFSDTRDTPLVLKVSVPPSRVAALLPTLASVGDGLSIAAHAGNGIVLAKYKGFSPAAAAKALVAELHPAAAKLGGAAMVWSCSAADELTRQAMWGGRRAEVDRMRSVKLAFDPKGLLNPGRFYHG